MIGQDIAAALPALRAEAESLMVDACEVGTITSGFDEATNTMGEVFSPIYTGPARVVRGNAETTTDAAGQQVTVQPVLVHLPWTVTGAKPGMRVRVTSSSDPDLVGARLVVATSAPGSQRVQRRLVCHLNEG